MTSNIGSHLIRENMKDVSGDILEKIYDDTRNQIFELLKQTLRPEFLNRIDDIIVFKPLTLTEVREIVKIQFSNVQHMLEQNNIRIKLEEKAVDWLASQSYDPQYGARPVKRIIQKYILNELSKKMINQEISKDELIIPDIRNDQLIFKNTKSKKSVAG